MSASTRHAVTRTLRQLPSAFSSTAAAAAAASITTTTTTTTATAAAFTSRRSLGSLLTKHQHSHLSTICRNHKNDAKQLFSTARPLNKNSSGNNKNTPTTTSTSGQPGSGPGSIEQPPITIQPPILPGQVPILDVQDNVKSIEQVIAELDPDVRTSQTTASFPADRLEQGPGQGAEGSHQQASGESGTGSTSSSSASPPPSPKKKPSRFWYYLYLTLLYSAVGSIPVQLLLVKSEAKDLKQKQEWKIAVLTDMRDKLNRGESVEEEEALLSVGMDRSSREEQVDDKYFEELLASAEKLDFVFGKDKDTIMEKSEVPASTPAPTPTPAPPVVPRKPVPPKTEKSYL
ncbi:hypothetical protein EDD11_004154 [Mortierella claussenii]|nr:hypothetical protein EDD11_004154 [Mortierella claussenii]